MIILLSEFCLETETVSVWPLKVTGIVQLAEFGPAGSTDRWIAMQHKRKFLAIRLAQHAWAVWREGNKLPIKAPDGKVRKPRVQDCIA